MRQRLTDNKTAEAFAQSWNNLPRRSVYTKEQFEDWFAPLDADHFSGKSILELGCGNGSLLVHLLNWKPKVKLNEGLRKTIDLLLNG